MTKKTNAKNARTAPRRRAPRGATTPADPFGVRDGTPLSDAEEQAASDEGVLDALDTYDRPMTFDEVWWMVNPYTYNYRVIVYWTRADLPATLASLRDRRLVTFARRRYALTPAGKAALARARHAGERREAATTTNEGKGLSRRKTDREMMAVIARVAKMAICPPGVPLNDLPARKRALDALVRFLAAHPDLRIGQALWAIAGCDPFNIEDKEIVAAVARMTPTKTRAPRPKTRQRRAPTTRR